MRRNYSIFEEVERELSRSRRKSARLTYVWAALLVVSIIVVAAVIGGVAQEIIHYVEYLTR